MPPPDVKRYLVPAKYGFGVEVPKGGSSCSTCFYVSKDYDQCRNAIFQRYEGTAKLGAPADRFCCPLWAQEDLGDLAPSGVEARPPAAANEADVEFVRGMVPHHEGAVDAARKVLAEGADPEVRRLALNVVGSQQAEIAWMKRWLEIRPLGVSA